MLPRLRHRAVRRRNNQDRSVHLRRSRDHVLHVVRVTRAVHVRVVTVLRLILNVRRRDGDPPRPLFRRLVNLIERRELGPAGLRQNLRDRRRQRRLAMVNMTNRANIAVRLIPLKLRLRHLSSLRLLAFEVRQPASFCRTSSAICWGTSMYRSKCIEYWARP